jgi:hypothetical protein
MTGRAYGVGFAIAVGLAGCAQDEDGRQTGSSGSGFESLTAGETEGSEGGTDAGSAEGGGTSGPGFDLGNADGEVPGDEGCQRVDFMFVIDNSVSMDNEQAQLVAAFPGFMDAIQNTLEAGSDYHVMAVDTDAWGRCDTAGWQGYDADHDTCNAYVQQTTFEECDRTLGAGVLHPAGKKASNMECMPFGGNRYLVEGEPDLAGTFACTATVGTAGHDQERPMDAMIAALQPGINGPGGCNDGFLRDDALLVVTFISDDPNEVDMGTPAEWYQAVVDAKHGDPAAVVVLGMTPAWPGCQDGKGPPKGAHWAEFIGLWGDHGLHGNVCGTAQEYIDFFGQAVAEIDTACDEYTPPG